VHTREQKEFSLTKSVRRREKEKGDDTMNNLATVLPSDAWDVIVILLLGGLYLVAVRILKLPWNARWSVNTPLNPAKANQLVNLTAAFYVLMAGALWMIAVATAQFTFTWGILLFVLGILNLFRVFAVRQEKR
jgi:hypothetical protein